MTNQSLHNKYFIETIGSSLVIVVINIQNKVKYITMLIGCSAIFKSNFFSYNNLAMNKKSTPNKRGSTGNESAKPMSKLSIFIERGVRNAIKNSTLSSENT